MLSVSLAYILKQGRGLTFFFDEWDFVLRRTFSLNDLLRPHNGHLSLVPVLCYNLLRTVFGFSYFPYQFLGVVVHGSVCMAVYALGRRRSAVLAACASVVVCLLGTGWQNIMWPFQIGMMGALSAGLWAIYEVSKPTPSSVKTAALVAVSLMCAGGGVAALATVLIMAVARKNFRAVFHLSVVGIFYGIWFAQYGASQSQSGNFGRTPQYFYDSAIGSAAAIGARGSLFSKVYFLVLIAFLVLAIMRKASLLVAVSSLMMIGTTWVMTGISRAHLGEPTASRYLYVGAVLLVLPMVLLAPQFLSGRMSILLVVLVPLLVQPNLRVLKAGTEGLRDVSTHVRASFTGLEIIDDLVRSGQPLDAGRAPQVDPILYLEKTKPNGNVGFTLVELANQPDLVRAQADDVLFRLMGNLYSEVPASDCIEHTKLVRLSIDLLPKQVVTVAPSVDLNAEFHWFTEAPEGKANLTLLAGKYYRLENNVRAGTKTLNIQFSGADISFCH